MLSIVLALASLNTAEAAPAPTEPLIVREHCFATPHRDREVSPSMGYGGGGAGLGAGGRGRGGGGNSYGVVGNTQGAGHGASAPEAARKTTGAAKPAPPPPRAVAEAEPAQNRARPSADADMGAAEAAPSTVRTGPQLTPPPRPGPAVEWGGDIHLSNDDSMSLASAQRILWALDRKAPIPLQHVRPHELLNYFSFDTAAPTGRDTFGISASADRTANDAMQLALTVTAATPPRTALDLTLVVDRSGSMSAHGRMDYTRRAMHLTADNLQPGDRMDLVLFDHEICTPLENFVVGRDDPSLLRGMIDRIHPRGATNLNGGLQEGYKVSRSHGAKADRARRVMLFTDAILNTGQIDPHVVSDIGRGFDREGIRLAGVGVGHDFRDDVLDRLTEKGKGAYVFLGSERVVDRMFGPKGFDAMMQIVAEDVRFTLSLPDSLGMTRFYGEESSRNEADVQPVHVHAGTSQVFFQDLAIKDGKLDRRDRIRFTARWTDPANGGLKEQQWQTTVGAALDADARNVRKARALMAWAELITLRAMGQPACGTALNDWQRATAQVGDDAELRYAHDLLRGFCTDAPLYASMLTPVPEAASTRVRIDTDTPIQDVQLTCGGHSEHRSLTGSDSVARFSTRPGRCDLTFFGAVPMTVSVDVPPSGVDLRCTARGGRVVCR